MNVLAAAYGGVARARRSWYARRPHRRRRLGRPVVSVGNLVVGGSGKTPAAAAIAKLLLAAGHRPAVLSRGYRRRAPSGEIVVVSDGERVLAAVDRSGDEPQMLARGLPGVPVLAGADRYRAGLLAERQLGATVLILDDGFQHVQLERNADLLIVSPEDLDERMLPSGRLREPLDAARAADALLVGGSAQDAAHVASALGVGTAFRIEARFSALRLLDGDGGSAPARGSGRVVAVAGIARPWRFFEALAGQGWDVARTIAFRDHHWFTPADLDRVEAAMRDAGAALVVTTEKDAVRIGARARWAVLPMEVAVEPADAFAAWLGARL